MPKEKLILEKKRHRNVYMRPVCVPSDIHGKIKDISNETGISMGTLTETCLEYALRNVEIMEERDEN